MGKPRRALAYRPDGTKQRRWRRWASACEVPCPTLSATREWRLGRAGSPGAPSWLPSRPGETEEAADDRKASAEYEHLRGECVALIVCVCPHCLVDFHPERMTGSKQCCSDPCRGGLN